MNTYEHLSKVLPTKGLKVLATMKPRTNGDGEIMYKSDGSVQLTTWHKTYGSIEELAKALRWQAGNGSPLYMAMAGFDREKCFVDKVSPRTGNSYRGFSRKAEYTEAFRSFWLDLDVGEEKARKKEGYLTQELALEALVDFVTKLNLPQPMLVNSGGGVHAYWTLTEDIDSDKWLDVAIKFDGCTKCFGLLVDADCTADRARILRPIGTTNHKYGTTVQLIEDAPSVDFNTFTEALEPYYQQNKERIEALKIKVVEYKPKDPDQQFAHKPRHAKYFLQRCQVGSYTLTGEDAVAEPVWRGVISVLRHCENGHKHIETLRSKCKSRFPETTRFDEDRTAEKLQWFETHELGPFVCDTFKKECPSICDGCPYADGLTIKTPLTLAEHYEEVDVPQYNLELGVVLPADDKADEPSTTVDEPLTTKTPQPPYPYKRTAHGLVVQEGEREVVFFVGDLFPVMTRFVEVVDGERNLMVKFMLRVGMGGGYHEISFPMKDWYAADRLKQKLGSAGVSIPDKQMGNLIGYLRKYLEHIGDNMDEVKQIQHFGWLDERQEFLLGNKLIREEGIVTVQPHLSIKNYTRYFQQSGSIHEWKRLMYRLDELGAVEQQICVLSSFGSTLMKFTNYNGVWLHLMTKPGYGKTTTQEMMNGIWGKPQDLLLNAKDTLNAIEERFGRWSSIGVAIDEVSNLDPMVASELLLGVTQGRTKQRLDTNMRERVNDLTWQLLVLSSGNFSLIDRINTRKEDVAAEISRTLEFKLPKPTLDVYDGEMLIKKPIRENYGVAGIEWLSNLVRIPHFQIQAMVDETTKAFSQKLKATSDERFWIAGCSVIYVAGILANKMRLLNWDMDVIFERLCGIVKANRVNKTTFEFSATDVISSFLAENTRNTVVTDTGTIEGAMLVKLSPMGALNVRYEQDAGIIYIRTNALKEYCSKRNIGIQSVKSSLEASGLLQNANKRVVLSKGLPMNTGRTYCLALTVDDLIRSTMDTIMENTSEQLG